MASWKRPLNIRRDENSAVAAFERAIQADPSDARILYERDQLWKRIGKAPEQRFSELQRFPELVQQRDDLSVELATAYNQLGKPEKALELLLARRFQPWEGGEGLVLGQYVRSHLLLGQLLVAEETLHKPVCFSTRPLLRQRVSEKPNTCLRIRATFTTGSELRLSSYEMLKPPSTGGNVRPGKEVTFSRWGA